MKTPGMMFVSPLVPGGLVWEVSKIGNAYFYLVVFSLFEASSFLGMVILGLFCIQRNILKKMLGAGAAAH